MRNRTSCCGISNYRPELWSVATVASLPAGSLAAVTDPGLTADLTAQAEAAQDLIAQIEAATDALGTPEQSDMVPLTELAEQLAYLHAGLHSALSELDRA